MLGSSTHLIQATRLDIVYVVFLMSRFLIKLTHTYRKLLKGVLRYLKNTVFLGIVYKHNINAKLNLKAYTDADWAGEIINDGKSTTGYIFYLAGGPISWRLKR